jgi:hypothetical protein
VAEHSYVSEIQIHLIKEKEFQNKRRFTGATESLPRVTFEINPFYVLPEFKYHLSLQQAIHHRSVKLKD